MLKLISFNAAILDIRLLGYSLYRPVDDIKTRLSALTDAIKSSNADVIFLQELFHRKNQLQLFHHLKSEYPYICGIENSGWGLRLGNELIVLSRHPLSDSKLTRFTHAPAEELRHTSKGFLHLKAALPTLGTVDLINFHMSAGGKHAHPETTAMEALRRKQIGRKEVALKKIKNSTSKERGIDFTVLREIKFLG